MNEIRLEKEEHNYIVSQTLALLRQRVVGNINTIHVEHVDQEFLALTKRDVGKSFPKIRKTDTPEERRRKANQGPESYDTMSVTSALQETVHKLLTKTRPHVPNATVSSAKMILMGHEVLRFLRQQRKKNIVLPHRLAQIITDQMDGIENDISLLSSRLEQKLESRDSCPENERTALSQEIDNLLREIQALNEKLTHMQTSYDCSSIIPLGEEEEEEGETFYNNNNDGISGVGLIESDEIDILFYEEDMRMSPSEVHLIGYIPHDIRESDSITQDTFYWSTEGEEWQRSSFHVRDFPSHYKNMLEIMLRRKRIIAFYAEKTLETEEKKREKKKTFGGLGLGKIRKYLPQLHEEIETLVQKISAIVLHTSEENEGETISEPEAIKEQLEGNLDFLHERFDLSLISYIKIPANRAQLIRDIEKIQQEAQKAHQELAFYCQQHGLQSQYVSGEDTPSDKPPLDRSIVPTVEDYLEHPDFFENFPDVLLVQKSDAEKNLEVLCELQNADERLLPDVIESDILSFIYREEDGTESTTLQKMEALEGALQILQRRKMITYFHAHRFEKTHPNEEIQYHLNILKHEIEHMQSCINMITSRIDWEDNENAEPDRDLYREIEELGQRRFHFLESFVEAADHRERALIGQKIFTLCHALEKRRNTLADITNNPQPENSIPAPPMGRHEVYCLRYILPDIRHSERHLFWEKIPYSIDSGKSARENKQETLKLEWSFVTERRMLLYFFMMNRLTEIDILIMDTSDDEEAEQLIQERTELEGYTGIYYREITEGLRYLVQEKIEKDDVPPKKLHYQELYNEAMKMLGELDGAEASVEDNEHAALIRSYWIKIQTQVLRFSDRIVIEEQKGNLHMIPKIQKEFDEEVRLIMHDIEIYLSRILGKYGYKGDAPDVLLEKAKRVRIQIFGGR